MPPHDYPALPPGWNPVCYVPGPPPEGEPVNGGLLKTLTAKRKTRIAGLTQGYERTSGKTQAQPAIAAPVTAVTCAQAVFPPNDDDEVSADEKAKMEAWLRHVQDWAQSRSIVEHKQLPEES